MIGRPVVGRSFANPNRDLFYWLEARVDGLVQVSRPGNREQKEVGYERDFRDYGDVLAERVNPRLAVVPLERRHVIRERLIAVADRDWDTYGVHGEVARRARRC
jgi:hypothetical protein